MTNKQFNRGETISIGFIGVVVLVFWLAFTGIIKSEYLDTNIYSKVSITVTLIVTGVWIGSKYSKAAHSIMNLLKAWQWAVIWGGSILLAMVSAL